MTSNSFSNSAQFAMHDSGMLLALLDSIPDLVFFKDVNGIYLGCNPAFAEFVGRKRDEIIGRTDYDLFSKGVADFFRDHDRRMLEKLESRHNEEWITYPDGRRILIDTLKTPYRGADGTLLGILGISRDVTEKKRFQEKLIAERQRLASIIEGTGVGTWEWNVPAGEVVFNARWAEMLGYSLQELAPVSIKTWLKLVHPEDLKFSEELLRMHFGGETERYDCCCRMQHKDGHWVWVRDVGKVTKWLGPGRPLIMFGTHSDISHFKRIEEEINQSRYAAEASLRSKSEFLANMSHEIRTPINGILGMTQLMEDTPVNEEQREYLRALKTSGDLLLGIINDILDLSKIEAGRVDLYPVDFDLKAILENLQRMLSPKLAEKRLEFILNMPAGLQTHWHGDSLRLQQVLMNLLSNAIKFTPETGGIVLQIQATGDTAQPRLEFSVSDTGIGIPRDKQGEIFKAFTQADGSTTRQFGGTGLGLTISEKLVQMMGGALRVQSLLGIGSVFYFDVPLEEPRGRDLSEKTRAEVHNTTTRPLRVLVAEDNLVNQKLISRMLEKAGHSVTLVDDGSRAVAAFQGGSFDLIFMDIQMPGMDGVLATAELRALEKSENRKKTPIVALTAHALEGDREKYLRLGMDDYVSKPIDRNELFRVISSSTKPG